MWKIKSLTFASDGLPAKVFLGDITDIRRHTEEWCYNVAGARVHGTTRRIPRETYETSEQSQMQPAPTSPFDVPHWSQAKVHPDHHVKVQKALYSVPTRFIGKTLAVRADRSTVNLYLGLELIKTHPRKAPGQWSTDVHDFPQGKAPSALRNVEAVIRTANSHGDQIGRFTPRLVDGPLPPVAGSV